MSDVSDKRGATGGRGASLLYGIVIAVVVLVAGAVLLWWAKFATYHFAVVQAGVLYRDGNRGIREFSHAVERGKIKTVVALIDDGELASARKPEFGAEMAWCAAHGVKVARVVIPLGGWPTGEDVKRFLSVVSDKANQPVLVHCAQGVRRTGMMVAAYQRSAMGWDALKCKGAMLTFGHSSRTVGDVEKFIEVYDPGMGRVPEGMAVGRE